ncbi:chemotaxis protein CheW [Sulfitobacter alexandrii]|uniref:Chemotaxis protein CheW n=1 Tax=Sulfitobacter alexandrii TaxID=1917485 RepID=A0A1J0WGQ3_9RHOB|nr:chemotaxis protein CheW [Sulfitobacter alexandrii]APE43497.1 chemotaxis protein CheW [Sulfitobacter alexandrii]
MTDTTTPSSIELLTFQLADQEYAIDIMSVREIRGWTRATPLPQAPRYMKGVINLRGTVLPVMDLAQRLGLAPRAQGDRAVIIVVKHEDSMTGLLVDAVSDIVALTTDNLQVPPDGAAGAGGVVSALTLIDDRMIRVLDLGATVNVSESLAA